MKASCLAIVNSQNDTLWVRSDTSQVELAAQALSGMLPLISNEAFQLIKSYEDNTGKEQFVEILTPWANAYWSACLNGHPLPGKAVIEVWQETLPAFGRNEVQETLDLTGFSICASFLVPYAEGDEEPSLEKAYEASQNLSHSWRPGKGCRSSSTGDIFIISTPACRQAYIVCSSGFKKVPVSAAEVPTLEAPATALSLSVYRAEAYLKRLGSRKKVRDLYDEDETLQGALAALIPDFEYPDWSHKTIGEILSHVSKKS